VELKSWAWELRWDVIDSRFDARIEKESWRESLSCKSVKAARDWVVGEELKDYKPAHK
jgi:hypothetical protein